MFVRFRLQKAPMGQKDLTWIEVLLQASRHYESHEGSPSRNVASPRAYICWNISHHLQLLVMLWRCSKPQRKIMAARSTVNECTIVALKMKVTISFHTHGPQTWLGFDPIWSWSRHASQPSKAWNLLQNSGNTMLQHLSRCSLRENRKDQMEN